jgi:hypothetical protein
MNGECLLTQEAKVDDEMSFFDNELRVTRCPAS